MFDDMINIKSFYQNKTMIGKKSYKNIFIYYIRYVAIKSHLKTNSANPLYLVIGKLNGCFREINENKY